MPAVAQNLGTILRFTITLILFALAAWWLLVVYGALDVFPQRDDQGNIVDRYQRGKDILLVVLPLLTIALGYWFGAAGKKEAEEKAEKTQQKLNGVLDSTTETNLLAQAKEKYPQAFS
jgi:hypothetical protein